MTYTPEQARAMVRAAVRWAREMPEAGEDAIVALVLADAGSGQGGKVAGPHLPQEATPEVLRRLARDLLRRADATERLAEEQADRSRVADTYLAEAAVYQALADWLEREALRRKEPWVSGT